METDLERDVLEVSAEALLVAAVGGRGDAEDFGVAVEVAEHALVAVGERVVGFVNDDEVEVIARPTVQAFFTHEGLDGGDDDGRIEAGEQVAALSLGDDAGGFGELVGGLREQLLPMGEDERATGLEPLGRVGENHGLASGGREDGEQLAALTELREHGLDARRLVGAEVKTAHWRRPPFWWWVRSGRRHAARERARCRNRRAGRARPRPCCWRGR